MAIKLSPVEKDIAERKLKLLKLVKELKRVKSFKPRTKVEELALKLARAKGQVVYGSVVTSRYSTNIRPKDIDISSKSPYRAAKELQKALLKKKIQTEIKKKYIPTLKKHIYEINSVSYSPLKKSTLSQSELYRRLRQTKLSKEVKALSKTVADPSKQYRAKKDYERLLQLKKRIAKKKSKEEFLKQIEELKKQGQSHFFNVLRKSNTKWV